jgi:hypothetical protein
MEFMMATAVSYKKLYQFAKDFFEIGGSATMMLTRHATVDVCREAVEWGLVVVKIEGGFWEPQRFEARLDGIWDGLDPPLDQAAARENNFHAESFIRSKPASFNAFIITAAPLSGYLKS